MDISTIINIILCVFSFMLAAISVVTVVITLRQNTVSCFLFLLSFAIIFVQAPARAEFLGKENIIDKNICLFGWQLGMLK